MRDSDIQAQSGLLWKNNPVLVQLLGLSPVLAVSETLASGVALGVATLCVCLLSCLTASLVRNTLAQGSRLLWFMLILATYTTLTDILAQLYFYPLYLKLGIYMPLICCNAAILQRMETVSVNSSWLRAAGDGATTGLGFLLALVLVATCRELLISGTLFTDWHLLWPAGTGAATLIDTDSTQLFRFADTQAGVLILLGLLIALINFLKPFAPHGMTAESAMPTPAKRARVTGRLIRDESKETQ